MSMRDLEVLSSFDFIIIRERETDTGKETDRTESEREAQKHIETGTA